MNPISDFSNIWRINDSESRSISPENFTGEKGRGGMATSGTGASAARELGQGWKISPSVVIAAGQTFELAKIAGSGAIQHIWLTPTGDNRKSILRFYWDDRPQPAVECPLGDFFASGFAGFAPISSLAICVNPGNGFNCYWPMPFRERCRITLENTAAETITVYYQIDYALGEVPADAAYFHALFRRSNPLAYKSVHTILDRIDGRGHYVGTAMAWGSNSPGWWGEGEIKFFIDGDEEFPTICGTGTEDYFCGSYGFEHPATRKYVTFTTPYAGMPLAMDRDEKSSQARFNLYRWHITDPIRFNENLRVTIQALGWQDQKRYLPLQDDIASVAFWYQF